MNPNIQNYLYRYPKFTSESILKRNNIICYAMHLIIPYYKLYSQHLIQNLIVITLSSFNAFKKSSNYGIDDIDSLCQFMSDRCFTVSVNLALIPSFY